MTRWWDWGVEQDGSRDQMGSEGWGQMGAWARGWGYIGGTDRARGQTGD